MRNLVNNTERRGAKSTMSARPKLSFLKVLSSKEEKDFFNQSLTFWRRNYFFLILAHSVYKMWIKQDPNTLELWNKLHFEEKKTDSIYHV